MFLSHKRDELMHYLYALSNPDYQYQAWVNQEFSPEIGHDSFGYVITFFFEDTMLGEAPEKNVGTILEDHDEVVIISRVTTALVAVLTKLGDNRSDHEYISSPDWQKVVNAANEAVRFYSQR